MILYSAKLQCCAYSTQGLLTVVHSRAGAQEHRYHRSYSWGVLHSAGTPGIYANTQQTKVAWKTSPFSS